MFPVISSSNSLSLLYFKHYHFPAYILLRTNKKSSFAIIFFCSFCNVYKKSIFMNVIYLMLSVKIDIIFFACVFKNFFCGLIKHKKMVCIKINKHKLFVYIFNYARYLLLLIETYNSYAAHFLIE